MIRKHINFIIALVVVAVIGLLFVFLRMGGPVPESGTGLLSETTGETFASSTDMYEIELALPPAERTGENDVRGYLEQEVRSFVDFANENPPSPPEHTYLLTSVIETFETDTHLSHLVVLGMLTGGASSNALAKSFVYDQETEARIELTDLVPQGERSAFVERVKTTLRQTQGSNGVFEEIVADLTFEQLGAFVLEEEGSVTLVFSKYEIAPGAAGIVRVTVSLRADTAEEPQEEEEIAEEQTHTVALNEPFEVNGSTITVREVVGDSRCPVDVTCIWAGTVTIGLAIGSNDVVEPIELSLTESFNTASHTVAFTGVSPEPRSDRQISPEDYQFTFTARPR